MFTPTGVGAQNIDFPLKGYLKQPRKIFQSKKKKIVGVFSCNYGEFGKNISF